MTNEQIDKLTDIICTMMLDFQSRTPDNPITREDIRGYVVKVNEVEEPEKEELPDREPTYITFPVGHTASTW